MKKVLLFVFFLMALFVTEKAQASHVMGSDIVYKCLGNGKYELTVRVYRDCNGIQVSQANVIGRCSSSTITISSQTKVSTRDITGIDVNCPVQSRCGNPSSSFPFGVQEHIWTMTVDLSSYSCCEWTFSWEQCCRNGNITTGQSGQNFFTTATLNKCVTPCNSSPDFTNPPVAIICQNQDFVFNNGALDTIDSGDSLSYELVNGLTGLNSSVSYSGNFSPVRPMTFFGFPNQNLQWPAGFHLDALTGDLLFRPTQVNQVAIVVIEVKEWRMVNGNMEVVGRTRRDMQIIVVPCPNNKVPKIKPPYSKQACAGQTTCITIATEDDDNADTVRITWNKGIRGATFTHNSGAVKHASGEVCWTPTENDISNIPYTFTITARDDACPLAGQSVRAFSIFVRETPDATLKTKVLTCGKVAIDHTAKKSYAGYQFNYVIRDSLNRASWSGNTQVDTAFLQPGVYRIFLNMQTSTPCFNIVVDSIVIPAFVQVTIPSDTFICSGYPMSVISKTKGGNSPYVYEWHRLNDTTDSLLTTSPNITVNPDTNASFIIQVKDANGCYNWDTINIAWKPLPKVNLGPDVRLCSGNLLSLDGGNDTTILRYDWVTGDTTRKVFVKDSLNYWVKVTDTVGCSNYDTMQFRVNDPRPIVGTNLSKCNLDTVRLNASGVDSYQWYYADQYKPAGPNTPISTNSYYDYVVTQSRTFIVRGTATYKGVTCSNIDSIRVNMNPLPTIVFNPQGPHCVDAGPITLLTYLDFPTLYTGTWRSDVNPTFVKNGIFYPDSSGASTNALQHQVIYRVTDNNGCTKEASVRVNILPLPIIELPANIALCGDVTSLDLSTALFTTHSPSMQQGIPTWSSFDNNPAVNANIVKTPANSQKLLISNLQQGVTYPLLYNYKNNTTKCSKQAIINVRVKTVPNTNAGTLPDYCWNEGAVNLNSAANPSPGGGDWTADPNDIQLNAAKNGFNTFDVDASLKFNPVPGKRLDFTYTSTLEGCSKSDVVSTLIKVIPEITLNPLAGVCEDSMAIDLQLRGSPQQFGSGFWSGPGVSSNKFDPAVAGVGSHRLVYTFKSPSNQCSNSDSFVTEVQAKPTLTFLSPDASCAGLSFKLDIDIKNAPGFMWSRLGDGFFESELSGKTSSFLLQTEYFPGSTDIDNEGFIILGETTNPIFCQPARLAQSVKIYPIPTIEIKEPLDMCDTSSQFFEAFTDAAPGYELDWKFSDRFDTTDHDPYLFHILNGPGTYSVNLTIHSDSAFGYCVNEAIPVDVVVFPKPIAAMDASRWKTTVALPGIQFYDKSTIGGGGTIKSWDWTFGDRNNSTSKEKNPSFEYPITEATDTGTFPVTLHVISLDGCDSWAYGKLIIEPDITVFIPNAFTPNGFDVAINNRFYVFADGFETFEMTIFNRWGERMYQSSNILEGWDGSYKGTDVQEDVYVYVVRVTSLAGKEFEYYGTITLLR